MQTLADPSTVNSGLCEVCNRFTALFNIGASQRCLRCALTFRLLLRRSALTALFVGTVLTGINQGNIFLGGDLPASLAWKIPLTYCVPFCVATWGALINSRLQKSEAKSQP